LGSDDLSGGEEVFGAVTEGARAQPAFARFCENLGGRERVVGAAESLAEVGVDLADLNNLFEGGADKIGEAFPWIFTKGS